jgi:hypothetical protein
MSNRSPRWIECLGDWLACAAAVTVLATMSLGCASSSTAHFVCDTRVNDGLLLTIDLIEVADEEAQQIRQTGDDWFYSDLRRQLAGRTKTIAVKGGCDQRVDLTQLTAKEKVLRKKKGYGILAVIGDYQTSGGERLSGTMQFLDRDQWKGKTTLVRVHDAYLTVEGSR